MRAVDLFAATVPRAVVASVPDFPRELLPAGWDVLARPTIGPWVAQWMARNLRWQGEAFTPNDDQLVDLAEMYSVDLAGRWQYGTGSILVGAKGEGKSIIAAADAVAQLVGPVRVAGWGADGLPRARATVDGWVDVAGVSEFGTFNTMSAIRAMLTGSPLVDEFAMDVGQKRILARGTSGLWAVSASFASLEGRRETGAYLEESQHLTPGNSGDKLHAVLRRNLAKTGGRLVQLTNAPLPMDNVAHDTIAAVNVMREQTPDAVDTYLRHRTVHLESLDDIDALRDALAYVYGAAARDGYVDLDRLILEIADPQTEPEFARRWYLNEILSEGAAWVSAAALDACPVATLQHGDDVVIGIDTAGGRDASAMVAVRLRDGAAQLVAYLPGGGTDEQLHGALASTFATYSVWAVAIDPHPREDWTAEVEARYTNRLRVRMGPRSAVECDQRGSDQFFGRETIRLQSAIINGAMPWHREGTAGGILRRDILNTIEKENGRMGKSSRHANGTRIDAATALLNGAIARRQVLSKHPGAFPAL